MTTERNEVDSTYEIVKKHIAPAPITLTPTTGPGAVLVPAPEGVKLHDYQPVLDARLPAPRRTKGESSHETLASFDAHVLRFKNAETSVFVEGSDVGAKLVAVYNYDGPDAPAWRDHRAVCRLPLSDEWKAWQGAAAKKGLSQTDFAAFIEERIGDLAELAQVPGDVRQSLETIAGMLGVDYATRARVRQLAYGLQISAEVTVAEICRSENGEGRILFDEKHVTSDKSGAPIAVPGAFLIAVPVFAKDSKRYAVPVRLSYKRQGPAIVWSIALYGADDVRKLATDELLARIAVEAGVSVYAGSPEPAAQ